jgi:hypothetical protein
MATPAKKQPAKPAAKASKSTSVTVWEQKMAAAAQKQATAAKPTGLFKMISTRGGILSVDDTPIKGNELRVVILAGCHENQYYDGPFRPDTPQSPVCYAFSGVDEPGDGMVPHEQAKEKQCGSCDECELNVMGSAEQGKGKACKNVYRLALVTEDAVESEDAMAEAEIRMMKVPVTSVKNWAKYSNMLNDDMTRPSWGVVTKISLVQDAKTQFKVLFEFEELINFDSGLYEALEKRVSEVSKDLVAPYPDIDDEPAPARGRGKVQGRAAAKPAAKKPAAKVAAKARR